MGYTRNYQREYAIESKSRRKKRVNRNAARRKMMKLGKVKKGDGKDVHHVGGNALNKKSKLKVVSASKNRSYARTKNASKKFSTS
jgi:precorrin-6B methylase 2